MGFGRDIRLIFFFGSSGVEGGDLFNKFACLFLKWGYVVYYKVALKVRVIKIVV